MINATILAVAKIAAHAAQVIMVMMVTSPYSHSGGRAAMGALD